MKTATLKLLRYFHVSLLMPLTPQWLWLIVHCLRSAYSQRLNIHFSTTLLNFDSNHFHFISTFFFFFLMGWVIILAGSLITCENWTLRIPVFNQLEIMRQYSSLMRNKTDILINATVIIFYVWRNLDWRSKIVPLIVPRT